ncbi:YopX family protein [Paenibacillus sp. O199]|uniref:YopX family protein n=1 Tax=Paenibacillus sp. O199 TaxID=1643925 RepID=UPI0007BEE0C4|nr:YopX family protein [Paenibacillus sp. O199]
MRNKHRGKHIETGEWIKGYLIGDDVIVGDIVEWDEQYFCTEFWYLVDPVTVGQSIGKADVVSKEDLFEGDILSPNWAIKEREAKVICYDTNQSKYKAVPLSMYLANAGNGGWTGYDIEWMPHKIGNIHDNPELLED